MLRRTVCCGSAEAFKGTADHCYDIRVRLLANHLDVDQLTTFQFLVPFEDGLDVVGIVQNWFYLIRESQYMLFFLIIQVGFT